CGAVIAHAFEARVWAVALVQALQLNALDAGYEFLVSSGVRLVARCDAVVVTRRTGLHTVGVRLTIRISVASAVRLATVLVLAFEARIRSGRRLAGLAKQWMGASGVGVGVASRVKRGATTSGARSTGTRLAAVVERTRGSLSGATGRGGTSAFA